MNNILYGMIEVTSTVFEEIGNLTGTPGTLGCRPMVYSDVNDKIARAFEIGECYDLVSAL